MENHRIRNIKLIFLFGTLVRIDIPLWLKNHEYYALNVPKVRIITFCGNDGTRLPQPTTFLLQSSSIISTNYRVMISFNH
jgi:lysophospholipase L1-like esterase